MKCHYCGTELPENAVFCRHCGTRQEAAPAPVDAKPAAPTVSAPASCDFSRPVAAPAMEDEAFSWDPQPAAKPAPAPSAPAPVFCPVSQAPWIQLPVKRSLVKMIFLSILTLGIYPTVIWSRIVTELNIAASRYDGRRTMSYFGMLLLSPITLGIHTLVWMHEFSNRIGSELRRRNQDYRFGAKDFWIWNFLVCILVLAVGVVLYILLEQVHYAIWAVLGIICVAGPFVYIHKLMKAMNLVNADFNVNG